MPLTRPSPDPTSAANALRSRGLRVSGVRRRLLAALYAADGPVTAGQLAGGEHLGSVYRNLAALEQAGIVSVLRPGSGARLFAVRGREPAALACCDTCGEWTALDSAAAAFLREVVRTTCGLELAFAHHALVGRCRGCAEPVS